MGFCCAWPQPYGGQAKVVSARLNPRNGTIYVGGVCNFSSVLSHHSKNLKQWTNQCYSSVFLGKTKDSMPSGSEGELTQKTKRREASVLLGFLLLYICLLPAEPALCKLGQRGGLFVLPEVLTPGLRPSFVLFLWAFPFFVF